MESIKITEELMGRLAENAQSLSEMNLQIQPLYDTIRSVENSKDKQQLLQVYKQMYDAYGKNVESFGALIKEIRRQVENEKQ